MKNVLLKLLLVVMIAALLGTVFVGCSPKTSTETDEPTTEEPTKEEPAKEEPAKEEPAKKEPREITAMILQSRNFEGLQHMIEKLDTEEGIYVDTQVIPDDQYRNLLKMKVNSGEATDIMDENIPHLYSTLDPEKYFVDLSDEAWVEKLINPGLSQYNGKTYAYTFQSTNGFQGVIYNKDVFEANGLEVPTTVEEFDAVCDALLEAGITPMLLASDPWVPQIWMTAGYVRALGSKEACQESADKILTNQAKLTDYPELVEALDTYLGMFEKGYMNEDYLTLPIDGVYERLAAGEGAMLFGSSGMAATMQEGFPEMNIGMFNLPTDYDEQDILSATEFSYGFAVSNESENIDTAKEVFNLWSTPEYGDLYYATRPGYPAIEGINGGEIPAYAQEMYEKYIVAGKSVPEMNLFWNPVGSLYDSTLWIYYQEAPSKGNMTSYDILERFQQDITKLMTEQKAPGFVD